MSADYIRLFVHVFCHCSNPSWRWRSQRVPNGSGETRAWTVTRTLQSPAAAAIRSRWTSKTLAGTGLLPQSATRPTIAPGSVSTCTYRSTHTLTWWTRPTPEGQQAPAVPPPRCHPSTCSTLTERNRSSTARSPPWWWTVVDAFELGWRGFHRQTFWHNQSTTSSASFPAATRCNRTRVEATERPTFPQGSALTAAIALTFLPSSEI